MAILDITEYAELGVTGKGHTVMAGIEPSLGNQQVAITGAALQSVALKDNTKFVRIHCDAACRVKFGANPTADPNSMRLAASGTEYLGVSASGLKISVISTT